MCKACDERVAEMDRETSDLKGEPQYTTVKEMIDILKGYDDTTPVMVSQFCTCYPEHVSNPRNILTILFHNQERAVVISSKKQGD